MSDFTRTLDGNELFVNSNESTLDLILRLRYTNKQRHEKIMIRIQITI